MVGGTSTAKDEIHQRPFLIAACVFVSAVSDIRMEYSTVAEELRIRSRYRMYSACNN